MRKIISGTMDITKHNEVSIIERDVKFTIVIRNNILDIMDTEKLRELIHIEYYPKSRVDIFPKVESIIAI